MKYVLIGGGVLLAIGLAVTAFLFGKGTSAVPPTATPAPTEETVVEVTPVVVVTAQYIVVTATPAPGETVPFVTNSSWTPAVKCEWLRANFPQTGPAVQEYIAQLANVPRERVASHQYPCTTTDMAYDGGIILGPDEGWTTTFTVLVPQFGAVDAYPGAGFSVPNQTMQIGPETVRAFEGSVTAVRATYWPWLDEAPPIFGVPFIVPAGSAYVSSQTSAAAVPCIQPTDLATQMGWRTVEWADQKYGGLRVELTTSGQLPSMWEALASGRQIKEADVNREMVTGFWTVYPPYACREELGFSK